MKIIWRERKERREEVVRIGLLLRRRRGVEEDLVKKEEDDRTDNNDNGNSFENVKRVDSSEAGVKEEVNDEPIGGGRGSTTENGGVSTTNVSFLSDSILFFTLLFSMCVCYFAAY
jgi:U4/U6 small nuclear ribonucleoprotein PRP3